MVLLCICHPFVFSDKLFLHGSWRMHLRFNILVFIAFLPCGTIKNTLFSKWTVVALEQSLMDYNVDPSGYSYNFHWKAAFLITKNLFLFWGVWLYKGGNKLLIVVNNRPRNVEETSLILASINVYTDHNIINLVGELCILKLIWTFKTRKF